MTALSVIQDLLSRELGTTGWAIIKERGGGATLRTQRGEIPFSTLKLLVEAVPDALREAVEEGYADGLEDGRLGE